MFGKVDIYARLGGRMKDEGWQRRAAIQIAAQLPERTDDALTVLRLATELVETFLMKDQPRTAAAVVDFSAASNSCCNANGSVSRRPK